MVQLHAGFFLSALSQIIDKKEDNSDIKKLIRNLFVFDADGDIRENPFSTEDSILAIAQKIISYAHQKQAPLSIENQFAQNLKYTQRKVSDESEIQYPLIQDIPIAEEAIYQHLHIIDPRISNFKPYLDFNFKLGASKDGLMENFMFSYIPTYLGSEFVQLLEVNPEFLSFFYEKPYTLKSKTEKLTDIQRNQVYKNIDFNLVLPYSTAKNAENNWIEIDDQEHEKLSQKEIDKQREELSRSILKIDTMRIPVKDFSHIKSYLDQLKAKADKEKYFSLIKRNYSRPLYNNSIEFKWMQLVLSPIAIARIESVLINLLLNNQLSLKDEFWTIAVIERDVPAAYAAIEDFNILMSELFKLEGKERKLPAIRLHVFNTKEFEKAELNKIHSQKIKLLSEFPEQKEFDVLIDLAMLERMSPISALQKSKAKIKLRIRSAHRLRSFDETPQAKVVYFKKILSIPRSHHSKYISLLDNREFFARNILRIDKLKDFQLNMLDDGLAGIRQMCYFSENQEVYNIFYLLSFLQSNGKLWISDKYTTQLAQSEFFDQKSFLKPFIVHHLFNDEEKYNRFQIINYYNLAFTFAQADCFSTSCLPDISFSHTRLAETQVFFDNVHVLSEWNTGFNSSFLNGLQALKKIIPAENFLLANTRSGVYNVLADISKVLKIPLGNIKIQEKSYQNARFYVNIIQITSENTRLGISTNVVNSRKQITSIQEIDEFVEKENTEKKNRVIVFTPENKGICGISDSQLNGIFDKISNKYEDKEISKLPATDPHLSLSQNIAIKNELQLEWPQFKRAEICLSNIHNTLNISDNHIQKIVFPFTPLNIEEIQNALAMLNYENAQPEVVFNFYRENNGIFEKQMLEQLLMSNYLGMEREKELGNELFESIHADRLSNLQFLSRLINNKFQLEVSLKPGINDKSYLLYLYESGELMGTIDERNWKTEIHHKTHRDIVQFLAIEIQSRIPEMEYMNKWLPKLYYNQAFKPFLQLWNKTEIDAVNTFVLPLENEFYGRYTELLAEAQIKEYADELINKNPFWNAFKPAFENTVRKKIAKEKEEELFEYFYKIRTAYQTRFILSKWEKLGFIDSYIENERNGTIECRFTKKELNYYKERIQNYFLAYFSNEFIQRVINKSVRDLPALWTQFINVYYREIQHFTDETSFEIIRFLQIQLAEQEKKSYRNLRAANYLRAYPFRKQSNSDFSDNLMDITSNLTRKSFEVVKEYVSQIGYKKSQWFDLLLSSKELLQKKPDYWVLHFLYGLASAVVFEKDTEGFSNGLDQLAQAFSQLRWSQKTSTRDFTEKQEFIYSKLENQDQTLRDQVEPVIELAMHRHWLQQFNQNFLSGYEG